MATRRPRRHARKSPARTSAPVPKRAFTLLQRIMAAVAWDLQEALSAQQAHVRDLEEMVAAQGEKLAEQRERLWLLEQQYLEGVTGALATREEEWLLHFAKHPIDELDSAAKPIGAIRRQQMLKEEQGIIVSRVSVTRRLQRERRLHRERG